MNRKYLIKAIAGLFLLAGLNACATKEIPAAVVVEPESETAVTSTEGSLWPGDTNKGTLFSDKKASRVGDIIMVYLIENTTATNKASTKTGRSINGSLSNGTGGTNNAFNMGFGGGRSFSGSGATTRSEAFRATISAMVSEVLPNGHLKIDGQRRMKINDAYQYVQVSGLVRPEDISYDNSIISSKIANAQIVYDGAGNLDATQKPGGIFGKAVDKVWPF